MLNEKESSAHITAEKVGNGFQRDKLRFAMTDILDGMTIFVAVAKAKGFRAAGERLDISGSAVSQAMRKLEPSSAVPRNGSICPSAVRMKLVLPAPFGPINAARSFQVRYRSSLVKSDREMRR